jgi:hypothetical protein
VFCFNKTYSQLIILKISYAIQPCPAVHRQGHISPSHLECETVLEFHCYQFLFTSLQTTSIIGCVKFKNIDTITAYLLNVTAITCRAYVSEMGRLQTSLGPGRVRWGGDAVRPI